MNALDYLGHTPLFLGTETSTWQLADFETAARSAKALGCTSLLIKIADGVLIWYSGIGGWQHVLDTVKAILPAIPYTYCYGNAFGALSNEIDILTAAMRYSGIAVADMEIPWNGRADWGAQVTAALGPVPGIFGVTTWADPEKQNWRDVISALRPCTDFWLPQAYSDFLVAEYQTQFAGLTAYPVLNLGSDFGPNNIIANAQAAKSPVVALWEYQRAVIGPYAPEVKQIVALQSPPASPGTTPAGWHDDGVTLTAPNNIPVVRGFRDYVRTHQWDAGNWPLEPEHAQSPLELSNTSLGNGTQQVFRWTVLEYTPTRGVFVAWCGQEMLWMRAKLNASKAS